MNETNIFKKVKQIFSSKDVLYFYASDLNTRRLIAEHYYDKYESIYNTDRRRSKNFKIAREIYSFIMEEYERVYP